MPLANILILAGIVTAFTAFAVALAWGECQTRNLKPARATPMAPDKHGPVPFKKAA